MHSEPALGAPNLHSVVGLWDIASVFSSTAKPLWKRGEEFCQSAHVNIFSTSSDKKENMAKNKVQRKRLVNQADPSVKAKDGIHAESRCVFVTEYESLRSLVLSQ
jgi:hypothetical protein